MSSEPEVTSPSSVGDVPAGGALLGPVNGAQGGGTRLGAGNEGRTPGASSVAEPVEAAGSNGAAQNGSARFAESVQRPPRIGTFYSLGLRNYRLLWASNLFGSVGMWIQMTTLGWVVYDLTGSSTLLGSMNGMRAIPLLLLAPLAGVVADRLNRRTLMLVTQAFMLLLTFGVAMALLLDQIQVWHLFLFTLLAGVVQVFLMPVQQTVVFDLVPRHAIPNAVALGSASFNVTRVFGPSLAGFLIAALGPEGNFFVQSAAYLGVLLSLLMITFPARRVAPSGRSVGMVGRNLGEGLRFVVKDRTVRALLMMGVIPPLLIIPTFMGLMPVFAKDVFKSGPEGLGFLLSATGVGGLLGALFAASLGRFERRGLLQLGALLMAGLALLGFAFSPSTAVALPLLALAGFFEMVYMTTTQTMVQLAVPDHMRGRVTSIFMLNMGLMPLGSLVVGALADIVGAPAVVAGASGLAVAVTVLVFLFLPRVRNLRLSQLAVAPTGVPTPVSPQP